MTDIDENSSDRLLLYLDVLGFRELMETPSRVRDLYQIMDRLNLHGHPAFRAIVFSDTLLVYNIKAPRNDDERRYYTMFLIEMAQDLLHRTIGREIYFRAVLTKGSFEHLRFQNLDAFFGDALVKAYEQEGSLVGVGLFIDQELLPFNQIFHTTRHCDSFHYVFLCQRLFDPEINWKADQYPVPRDLLDSAGLTYMLYPQIEFLRDVWAKARDHPVPKVRAKFQATKEFHESVMPGLCDVLSRSNFDVGVLSDADWGPAREHHENELASDYHKFDPANLKPFPDEE